MLYTAGTGNVVYSRHGHVHNRYESYCMQDRGLVCLIHTRIGSYEPKREMTGSQWIHCNSGYTDNLQAQN